MRRPLGQRAALVFVVMFLMELLSTLWILSIAEKRALLAATMAAMIEGSRALAIVTTISDRRMVIPLMIGSFLGTFAAVAFYR